MWDRVPLGKAFSAQLETWGKGLCLGAAGSNALACSHGVKVFLSSDARGAGMPAVRAAEPNRPYREGRVMLLPGGLNSTKPLRGQLAYPVLIWYTPALRGPKRITEVLLPLL